MSVRVSKKEMRNTFYIYGCHYCAMQTALNKIGSSFYSSGVYGWSCDYYIIEDGHRRVVISSGYNPTYDEIIPSKTLARIERYAEKLSKNWNPKRDDKRLISRYIIKEIKKSCIH